MATKIHQPRVAWDVAQLIADMSTAPDEQVTWFAGQLAERLGMAARQEFRQTRIRMEHDERPDIRPIEIGRWRARLEDELRTTPGLAEDLIVLRRETLARTAAGVS
jgi:hypothetical protein